MLSPSSSSISSKAGDSSYFACYTFCLDFEDLDEEEDDDFF